MRKFWMKWTFLAILMLAATVHAQTDFHPRSKIVARLIPQQTQVAPGSTLNILAEIKIAPGWHLQSYAPLESFLKPTVLQIKPDGPLAAAGIVYPDHHLIPAGVLSPTGQSHLAVYEGTIHILAKISIPADTANGKHALSFTLRTQACDDKSCLPPTTTQLSTDIEIATTPAQSSTETAAIFAQPDVSKLLTKKTDSSPADSSSNVASSQPVTSSAPTDSTPAGANELALLESRDYQAADAGNSHMPIWQLILFALAGGMILNIMPCVLPVIPLKAIQLIQQAHGNRRQAIVHGLVFSAGVITLFAVLAVVLTTVFAGAAVYGKQFQSAGFVITMALIILALALSMLGVWTINPPQAVYQVDGPKSGYAGSFFMGLLATLLATPCSAPMLGPVLAWALVQPVALTVMMFILVGIGMSLPYILLTAFPAAINRIPRAGRWADLLKQGLGIVMIGVSLWLLLQLPPAVLPWALFGALILSFVCWGWGQLPNPLGERSRLWATRGMVIVVGLLLTAGLFKLSRPVSADAAATGHDWQPLTLQSLDQALQQGRPVVIDWTADWCWNCIVLEKTVLSSESVTKSFVDHKAVLLKADLSHDNPLAETLLRKLNASAIPVLAVFSPQNPTRPVVLRDGYTRQRVVDEVAKAAR